MRRIFIYLGLFAFLPALLLATGSAFAGTVRIVVPSHDIARGETIGEGDLTFTTVDGSALMSGVPTRIEEVKGMQTRRMLIAGQPFRAEDVRRPIVVTKGQTVTIQNPVSYRMIAGTVVAPGTVRATGALNAPVNRIARR